MTRWKLTLEYDGADFCGWQFQPGQRSVQGVVEAALQQLFRDPTRVHPSGRTDAGVHALAQVAHFDAEVERTPREVRDAMNSMLPPDVAVVRAEVVPAAFDARHWVVAKTYRYRWIDRPARSPLRRLAAWHLRGPLDAVAMDAAAQHLVGEHDYSTFRASGCTADHAVRRVPEAQVRREGDEVDLYVRGHGFLRHMVRIMAGTLTEVGLGRRPVEWVGDVLRARHRPAGGRTAPARGLTLLRVEYGEGKPERRRFAGEAASNGPSLL